MTCCTRGEGGRGWAECAALKMAAHAHATRCSPALRQQPPQQPPHTLIPSINHYHPLFHLAMVVGGEMMQQELATSSATACISFTNPPSPCIEAPLGAHPDQADAPSIPDANPTSRENKELRKLEYYCKNCQFVEVVAPSEYCVYVSELKHDAKEKTVVLQVGHIKGTYISVLYILGSGCRLQGGTA